MVLLVLGNLGSEFEFPVIRDELWGCCNGRWEGSRNLIEKGGYTKCSERLCCLLDSLHFQAVRGCRLVRASLLLNSCRKSWEKYRCVHREFLWEILSIGAFQLRLVWIRSCFQELPGPLNSCLVSKGTIWGICGGSPILVDIPPVLMRNINTICTSQWLASWFPKSEVVEYSNIHQLKFQMTWNLRITLECHPPGN